MPDNVLGFWKHDLSIAVIGALSKLCEGDLALLASMASSASIGISCAANEIQTEYDRKWGRGGKP